MQVGAHHRPVKIIYLKHLLRVNSDSVGMGCKGMQGDGTRQEGEKSEKNDVVLIVKINT